MNKDDIKISIVVPFYNSEKTLDRCIKSLLNQDISALQFVLVDDGSTDNSLQLVNSFASEDERFLIISQPNKGQGAARNEGIRHAIGKYLLFVDSDDYLEPMTLKRMYEVAETNELDILTGVLRHINDIGNEYYFPLKEYGEIKTGRECLMSTAVSYSLCSHLFNRELLISNGLFMLEGVRYEDMDYCIRTTWFAKRVMNADIVFYNYMVHEGSVSNGVDFSIIDDYYVVTKKVAEFTQENVDSEAFEAYFREYLGFLHSHMVNLCVTKGFSISCLFENKERGKSILHYLKNSENKRYYIQYLLLKCRLYGLYKLLYRMKRQNVKQP